jgi:hypothetical protein
MARTVSNQSAIVGGGSSPLRWAAKIVAAALGRVGPGGEEHQRVGREVEDQLAPEGDLRPVDGRGEALEGGGPVRAPAQGGGPQDGLAGIREDLEHVVAAGAEQLPEGQVERRGAGAAEPRAHHPERHSCRLRHGEGNRKLPSNEP